MSLIDLPTAKAHLRVEANYPDEQVESKLLAAESMVAQFLNRRIYATAEVLTAAVAAVPATLTAAGSAYEAALEAAADIEDASTQEAAQEYACRVYSAAKTDARETYSGIVINKAIETAILLVTANLFENRGDDPSIGGFP